VPLHSYTLLSLLLWPLQQQPTPISRRLHRRQLPIRLFNQRPLILQLPQRQHPRRQRSQPYPVRRRFTLRPIDRRPEPAPVRAPGSTLAPAALAPSTSSFAAVHPATSGPGLSLAPMENSYPAARTSSPRDPSAAPATPARSGTPAPKTETTFASARLKIQTPDASTPSQDLAFSQNHQILSRTEAPSSVWLRLCRAVLCLFRRCTVPLFSFLRTNPTKRVSR
jgi:hypothetical protein